MRIISGNFKGKRIFEPTDMKTRPIKDLTKESIFNLINHSNKFSVDIKKSQILDLFSGTGSFGIECISREAKFVTFIENYSRVLPILKKNLSSLKSINNFEIIEMDIFKDLNIKYLKKKYDLIFMDPPYKEDKIEFLVKTILNSKILKSKGVMILHRHKKQQDNFPQNFRIIDERKYGISKIIFGTFS